MDGVACGRMIFSIGVAIVALGTVVYGVMTGEIPTVGGGSRYEQEMIWQSRIGEPRLFWFAAVTHSAIGAFFGYMALRDARGQE